jgi:hypothetical protein
VTTNTAYCNAPMGMSPEVPNVPELDESQVRIFPNPFQDRVQVRLGAPTTERGQLQVTNVQGAILKVLPIAPDVRELEVDLQDLPSGVYFLLLEMGDHRTHYERVIKR